MKKEKALTKIQQARADLINAGYEIVASGRGQESPEDKRSKLYNALQRARLCGYKDVTYRIGARGRFPSQGWQFVVGGKR